MIELRHNIAFRPATLSDIIILDPLIGEGKRNWNLMLCDSYRWHTELMAMVFFFRVVGSVNEADTIQQPQPPSVHILLVPVRPGWPLIHSLRLVMALAPSTLTGWLFKMNDTEVLGSITVWFQVICALPSRMHECCRPAGKPADSRIW